MGKTIAEGSVKDDSAVEATVMAIREDLMNYFKGTCIERFIVNSNVSLNHLDGDSRYYYNRRQSENERPALVSIGNVPIATVKKSPDRIIFHEVIVNRSPQLRAVKQGIENFLAKYLTVVEKEYSDGTKF